MGCKKTLFGQPLYWDRRDLKYFFVIMIIKLNCDLHLLKNKDINLTNEKIV